jgi:hypothetical protein
MQRVILERPEQATGVCPYMVLVTMIPVLKLCPRGATRSAPPSGPDRVASSCPLSWG